MDEKIKPETFRLRGESQGLHVCLECGWRGGHPPLINAHGLHERPDGSGACGGVIQFTPRP